MNPEWLDRVIEWSELDLLDLTRFEALTINRSIEKLESNKVQEENMNELNRTKPKELDGTDKNELNWNQMN